jgi:hypothetical protein
MEAAASAFEQLGYAVLKQGYGTSCTWAGLQHKWRHTYERFHVCCECAAVADFETKRVVA